MARPAGDCRPIKIAGFVHDHSVSNTRWPAVVDHAVCSCGTYLEHDSVTIGATAGRDAIQISGGISSDRSGRVASVRAVRLLAELIENTALAERSAVS